MFSSTMALLRRDASTTSASNKTPNTLTIALVVAVLVFALTAIIITAGFMWQRRRRNSRPTQLHDVEDGLPTYDIEKRLSSISTTSTSSRGHQHRRILTRADKGDVLYSEKSAFTPSPPQSPIPEIRITFPEEVDEKGQRKSGCVVVVRVGELGNVGGAEPPAYAEREGRWQSVDLERIGGLVEKARNAPVRRE